MDAFLSDSADLIYSDRPPVLLAASSEAAMSRAQRTIEAFGLRVGAQMSIEVAGERIEQQVAATALWVELDRDCGGPMDELLKHVSRDVAGRRYAAAVPPTARVL